MKNDKHRQNLIEIYHAGLAAVMGRGRVLKSLENHPLGKPVCVVAIGKAAIDMYVGAQNFLGESLAAGLVITKSGYAENFNCDANTQLIEAGHPWPTQASINAGQTILDFIDQVPRDGQLLFLISGGASSLAEVLPDGVSLKDLHRLNDYLLGSGLDIHAINHVRKSISCIKGGRLALCLQQRPCRVLLISDVPGDNPATIGSGLLVPETLLATEARLDLPRWVLGLMQKAVPMPPQGDCCFDHIEIELIAGLDDAKQAAAQKACALGYEVYLNGAVITGDAVAVANQLVGELFDGPPGVYIWGGETTVCLPDRAGRGGRNQHLALAAARELAGHEGVWFLSAGTDGSDGPTEDAGAIIDAGSLERGRWAGLNPEAALALADAGSFLDASGDLLQTGPTGTNVMDLILGLKL